MIIAFSGFKGAGKTTAARVLAELLHARNKEPWNLSFAGPLKYHVGELFDFDYEQLYGGHKETVDPRYQKTPRQVLQEVGTFCRETYGEDFWVRIALEGVPDRGIGIIDDCRYLNEAHAIQARKGFVIGIERADVACTDPHVSETEMRDRWEEICTHIIRPTSVDDLEPMIRGVLTAEGVL